MLKTAYGDAALSKTRVYDWFSRFKNGEMSIEDQFRSGRPSTSRTDENLDKINALVREDRRRTIDQLCEMSGISWSSIQRILSEDLHMRRVAAKFVPRLLTDEQRERRLQACFELQNQLEEDPEFFSKRCCARGVRSPGSNCQPEVLLGGFEKIEGEYPEEKGRSLAHRRLVLPS
ncbi:PREDICTED: putative uncharacterized protein FLJ37770 [Trachymyrmex septentrionalis]|nr:PREDICTED: putative uncharacterized protein FLJ37770 [Trachymyrmex septentrionalis]